MRSHNNTGGREERGREVKLSKFPGRKAPVAEFGEQKNLTVRADIDLDDAEEVEYMRELADSDEVWCYRDSSGRKLFGIVKDFSMTTRFYGGPRKLHLREAALQRERLSLRDGYPRPAAVLVAGRCLVEASL